MVFPSPNSNKLMRRIATLTQIVDGDLRVVDFPRQYDLDAVVARLYGTVNYSVAPSAVKSAGMAELLQRIDFFADGAKSIEEVSGPIAALGPFERKGKPVRNSAVTATTGAQTVDTYFRLDRVNADGPRPKDSSLHTQFPFISLLQGKFNFGALSDVFTGGTLASSALSLDVFVEETQEFSAEAQAEGRFIRRGSLQTVVVDANNSNLEVKLPVGAFLRGCKIYARNDTGNGDNTVVANAKIKQGVNVRMDMPFAALREKNHIDYGVAVDEQVDGLGYADLVPNGRLSNLFDLRTASEASLILDVVKPAGGNGNVDIEVIEYVEQAGSNG